MKKITFILGIILLVTVSFSVPSDRSHTLKATAANKTEKKLWTVTAYSPTGNPTNDYIYVHLWNPSHDYYFSVPPHAAAGYILGDIASECDYSVTLSSSGAPHTMQFYWFYASYTTSATSIGGMCPTCESCPTLNIYS